MAQYSVTCPKCGTINMASTGLFAKKLVKCARCGYEIDALTAKTVQDVIVNANYKKFQQMRLIP